MLAETWQTDLGQRTYLFSGTSGTARRMVSSLVALGGPRRSSFLSCKSCRDRKVRLGLGSREFRLLRRGMASCRVAGAYIELAAEQQINLYVVHERHCARDLSVFWSRLYFILQRSGAVRVERRCSPLFAHGSTFSIKLVVFSSPKSITIDAASQVRLCLSASLASRVLRHPILLLLCRRL